MSRYGLLIDYEFCSGCHTCEVACKMEHSFPVGRFGIKLTQPEPMQITAEKWYFDNIPVPTELCDLCSTRVGRGQQPACVKHCQDGVIKFGRIDELAKYMELKPRTVLFAPH